MSLALLPWIFSSPRFKLSSSVALSFGEFSVLSEHCGWSGSDDDDYTAESMEHIGSRSYGEYRRWEQRSRKWGRDGASYWSGCREEESDDDEQDSRFGWGVSRRGWG